jgi:Cysteine-rich secretory protein family
MNWVKGLVLIVVLSAALAPVAMRAQTDFDSAAEKLVLEQLNEARQQAGLPPLKNAPELVRAARQHSLAMAQQHKLSHQLSNESNLQERLQATGLHFSRSGENVGVNDRADLIHAAFMHSPPHRANLLTPGYNSVGIGIVHQGNNFWATEDFATAVTALSSDQAAARAAQAFAELRRQQKLTPLARVDFPQLRDTVCTMAKTGDLNSRPLLQMQGVRYTLTYTNAQPEVLPADVARIAAQPTLKRFAVGSCFVQNERAPGGIFWIAMIFY